MSITFTQQRTEQHQIAVCDDQERYFVNADEWTLQEVADAFLATYSVPADAPADEPVGFWIEYVEGSDVGEGWIATFSGFPGGKAEAQ